MGIFQGTLFAVALLHQIMSNAFATVLFDPTITVDLSLGKVVGTTLNPDVVDSVTESGRKLRSLHQFLGVPFAEPPLGPKLRFKKPIPVKSWSPKVVAASKWAPSCLQIEKMFGVALLEHPDFSEDCLYLNIWSPSIDEKDLKPVLVWVHGGAYTVGGAAMSRYHGDVLASTQDIVVVSLNYRLGALGFLVSPDHETAPGNAALWDIVMALEWVQEHIKQFGGDPNQVTLAGESAGSFSVSSVFVSPVVKKNLFNSVILMSGSSLMPSSFKDRDNEVKKTRYLAKILECPTDDDKKMMDCLLHIDGNSLIPKDMEIIRSFPGQESFGDNAMTFAPVTGDEFLPKPVSQLLTDPKLAEERKHIREMTGYNNWEGGIMKASAAVGASDIYEKVASKTTWYEGILKWLMNDYKIDETEAGEIIEHYYEKSADDHKREGGKMVLFDLIGDFTIMCPVYFETQVISKFVKSVHNFVFSYKRSKVDIVNPLCHETELVCHGSAVGFLLGTALYNFEGYKNPDHIQSMQAVDLIGKFARNEKLMFEQNGNGSKPEQVEWVEFGDKKKSLDLNYVEGNQFLEDFRGTYCNSIRKHILKTEAKK